MEKIKLNTDQKVIFQQALHDAYQGGSKDSTFLFNGMHELIKGEVKKLKEVTEKYCEDE